MSSLTPELRVTLSWPPSVNNLFLNVQGRGRVRSEAYKAWAIEAGYRVNRAARLKGPVSVSVALCAPDKRRRDADNSLKPILDLLVLLACLSGVSLGVLIGLVGRYGHLVVGALL